MTRHRIHLVNGTTYTEGRLEIFHNGRWGDVCGYGWGVHEAKVVCRMLGLPMSNPEAIGGSHFGSGHYKYKYIIYSLHGCRGTELDLRDCKTVSWENHQDSHHCHGPVGVRCQDARYTSSTKTTTKQPTTSLSTITTPKISQPPTTTTFQPPSKATTTPKPQTNTKASSKLFQTSKWLTIQQTSKWMTVPQN